MAVGEHADYMSALLSLECFWLVALLLPLSAAILVGMPSCGLAKCLGWDDCTVFELGTSHLSVMGCCGTVIVLV